MCHQMVVTKGVEAMQQVLGWNKTRTSDLLKACETELNKRLQQVQLVQSIRNSTQQDSSHQTGEKSVEGGDGTPAQGSD